MAPGLTGTAVNVTLVPLHTGPGGLAVIVTDGASEALTTITIGLEFATKVVTHVELDVMMHVITSPLFNVDDVNVLELLPTFIPFNCH